MTLPNYYSPEFPVVLKRIRKALGLTCRKLAEEAGITVTLISKYERPSGNHFAAPRQETRNKLNTAIIRLIENHIQKCPWLTGAEHLRKDNRPGTKWVKTTTTQ